ncbi:MarR family winged helix-turn-helix transcriptional regulator [Ottowia sp.]|uniref:MarR family winged helix-turn-helix transcriptional regulator n=1 Tax=Ottowia sp. TaxID=1898956 RepID=UPI0039E6797D
MRKIKRTPCGQALSDLMLDMFRLTSAILAAGDRLTAPLGLTSARWQVLGTIVRLEDAQPVASLARHMDANRQNVQRIINDMHKEGFVTFAANPSHRRAQLVVLTDKGREAYEAAMRLQAPWVNHLGSALALEDLQTMHQVVLALRETLAQGEQCGPKQA